MAIIYELGFLNYLWVIWVVSILFSIEYLRSILKYRHSQLGTFNHHTPFIIFQITTKGGESSVDNTIRKVRMACENVKLDKYRIDVVTDSQSDYFYNANMVYVPPNYETPNKSKYKARALQYAVDWRKNREEHKDNIWIYHLDSETVIDAECVLHAAKHIETSSEPVALGLNVFPNKFFQSNRISAFMESIRAAGNYDIDIQIKENKIYYLYGSNLLIRADVEDKVGWDFDTLAEDSAFGQRASYSLNYKVGTFGAIAYEQPALSLGQSIKQRERWFYGSVQNLPLMPPKLRFRQLVRLISWLLGAPSGIVTIWSLIVYQNIPIMLIPVFLFNAACIIFFYVFGLHQNIKPLMLGKMKRAILYCQIAVLAPVLSMLEGVGPFSAAVKILMGRQIVWIPTKK
jgi:beta-1,4-mannosyltransferase